MKTISNDKMKWALAIAILIGLNLNAVWAQGRYGRGGPARNNGSSLPPVISQIFDTDHDGILSSLEIANAPAVLHQYDTNGDAQLTSNELCPNNVRPAGRGAANNGRQPLACFDTNADGVLSVQEIAAATDILKKFDTNHDGQITGNEYRGPNYSTGTRGARGGWGRGNR